MNLSTKPKIAWVGGPDVYLRIELMDSLRDEFDMFAVGSDPRLSEKFRSAEFRYYHYKLSRRVNPLSDVLTIAQLFRIFSQERPAVVHAFDTKPCILARIAARLAGVPVVVGTLPGLGLLYADDRVLTRVVRELYEKLQTFASRLSDLTILQNHDDARRLVAKGILRTAKATVISGSGVSTKSFAPGTVSKHEIERIRSDLGIRSDSLVVTMISRLIRSKGVLEFALAARRVRNSQSGVDFLLVGPDDSESQDRLTQEQLSEIRQDVTWTGLRHDIRSVLAVSDIFVLPSFYPEGLPRVLLEAASMGLPMITTDSPGCRDVVQHGINGLLVPARDPTSLTQAIVRLAENPEMRHRFGQQSRRLAVDRFDISSIADQLGSVYRELLDKRDLPAPDAR